jgi:hypothetical protein
MSTLLLATACAPRAPSKPERRSFSFERGQARAPRDLTGCRFYPGAKLDDCCATTVRGYPTRTATLQSFGEISGSRRQNPVRRLLSKRGLPLDTKRSRHHRAVLSHEVRLRRASPRSADPCVLRAGTTTHVDNESDRLPNRIRIVYTRLVILHAKSRPVRRVLGERGLARLFFFPRLRAFLCRRSRLATVRASRALLV